MNPENCGRLGKCDSDVASILANIKKGLPQVELWNWHSSYMEPETRVSCINLPARSADRLPKTPTSGKDTRSFPDCAPKYHFSILDSAVHIYYL